MDNTSEPNLLPYGITSSAPAISLPNTDLFKSQRGVTAGNYFEEKLRQINDEYDRLVTLAKYTDIVYNSRYNFVPKVGQIYHLYHTGEFNLLSMIEPERWNKYDFVASFKFTADNIWEMQDGQEASDTTS